MKIKEQAELLSAESKAYDFNGNKGVSHKARFLIEGDIFVVKATPEQIIELQPQLRDKGEVELDFASRKELLSVSLVKFDS